MMNSDTATNVLTPQHLAHVYAGKNVVIIGAPASGKTFYGWKMSEVGQHNLISTDDYMNYGYDKALYAIMEDIQSGRIPQPHIIEGVLGYRLLRKGAELGTYYPDVVIEMRVTDELLVRAYEQRGEAKLKGARTMMKANETVLHSYREIQVPEDMKPMWVTIDNQY